MEIYVYLQHSKHDLDPETYCTPHDVDEEGNACIELSFTREMSKIMVDDTNMKDDEVVVIRYYLAGKHKKLVIERDTDILTKQEEREHIEDISVATLEELKIWVNYGTFQRWPKKGSQNIMTSRFVIKWKWIERDDGTRVRIIRMRMAIRGF